MSIAQKLPLLRGGAVHHPLVDSIGAAKLRIDGIHAYVFISILILNASLRLFTSTPIDLRPEKENSKLASFAFVLTIGFTFFGSIYSSTVFSLIELYTRTALGFGFDDGTKFNAFLTATQNYRLIGFWCFVSSLVSLLLSFPLSFYIRTHVDKKQKKPIFASWMTLSGIIILAWVRLLMKARSIFLN